MARLYADEDFPFPLGFATQLVFVDVTESDSRIAFLK
jgi:hypothetical protein